ncbi:L-Rhamnose isomerase [Acididesulfobacillus acetoxydans]|uniref:L-rhamnose isomerase n=2 Tax=Acididesulfobacillus acetoxydans TaxID=1561005 RepID=A0A8S0WY63_9FIRM|nr:L-Rhamnose isomerase [Acididesulfobacillus acetoxydans]CEJ08779.1 L-rhamnose isomerase [Acididesulfobacillus acetoxydans]
MTEDEIKLWVKVQDSKGVDIESVKTRLKAMVIETPTWGYGDSGTRFKVFKQQGAAQNPYEKLEDAAEVHRLTGVCPKVAVHIPWDKVDDYGALRRYALDLGLRIGAVNPNLFQDEDYALGSLCHPRPEVRQKARSHMLECVEIMKKVGSSILSLWLADGTNYPGQDDFRKRRHYLMDALTEVYQVLAPEARLLIEYKMFEPAFYHTDLADWGMAISYAEKLGNKAQVLVDLGHHAQGTNVAHIVATLLDEGKLGGFHFNNRKYADDDLMVGAIAPYELFLIALELVSGEQDPATSECAGRVSYMIDQSHNIEPKISAMIRSVMNIQTAFAKALLVPQGELRQAQAAGDVITAESLVKGAFETDVRPLLALVRKEMGLHTDPLKAYAEGTYIKTILAREFRGQG